ncbi:hypothetical protein L7F22_061402 [Adiantum nelumboides]|nr:hypothetical protein [Adiantum nelumboides]
MASPVATAHLPLNMKFLITNKRISTLEAEVKEWKKKMEATFLQKMEEWKEEKRNLCKRISHVEKQAASQEATIRILQALSVYWLVLTIVPIFKVGDPTEPGNYRAIMVGHTLARLYASILEQQLSSWAEDEGVRAIAARHKGKWEQYLPLVEYAYNNTVHSSTGKAPFEIVEGGKKVPPILHTKDKIFEADKYVQDMDEMYKKVKVALEKTQAKQMKAADSHRREMVFSLGDWVLLRFEKARLKKMKGKERLFPKLSMRYYGPFQACDKISDVAYRLKLPESWRIHNAFHVSLLRPYVGNVPEDLPVEDQPEVEELDEILVPEQILAHKERKVKGKVARRYLVKFRNYPPMDAKWMEEDLLKCYVSKHKGKWEQYLPLVEYAYNNTVHSSTGKAPFEIVEGGKKVPPILHTKDKIFEADKYVQDMDEMYKKVKVALEKTQAKQMKAADSHRREMVFSLGDWVLLRFEKARLKKMKGKERLFPKLSMRYYGPFQACDKISDVAYRLKLPESWRIHNAFHVSLLRPYVGNVPEDLPVEDQPEVEELDEILVPEQILAHKERKVKGKVARRYLVKFRNYPPMDAKWMEEGELAESPIVLSLYLEAFGLQPTLTP